MLVALLNTLTEAFRPQGSCMCWLLKINFATSALKANFDAFVLPYFTVVNAAWPHLFWWWLVLHRNFNEIWFCFGSFFPMSYLPILTFFFYYYYFALGAWFSCLLFIYLFNKLTLAVHEQSSTLCGHTGWQHRWLSQIVSPWWFSGVQLPCCPCCDVL